MFTPLITTAGAFSHKSARQEVILRAFKWRGDGFSVPAALYHPTLTVGKMTKLRIYGSETSLSSTYTVSLAE